MRGHWFDLEKSAPSARWIRLLLADLHVVWKGSQQIGVAAALGKSISPDVIVTVRFPDGHHPDMAGQIQSPAGILARLSTHGRR